MVQTKTCVDNRVLTFDDHGFPRQRKHSMVPRQSCEALGKVVNCQVAVTGVYAHSAVRWLVNTRVYLPQQWIDASARYAKAGVS
jgi:SRSO17 transposase